MLHVAAHSGSIGATTATELMPVVAAADDSPAARDPTANHRRAPHLIRPSLFTHTQASFFLHRSSSIFHFQRVSNHTPSCSVSSRRCCWPAPPSPGSTVSSCPQATLRRSAHRFWLSQLESCTRRMISVGCRRSSAGVSLVLRRLNMRRTSRWRRTNTRCTPTQ